MQGNPRLVCLIFPIQRSDNQLWLVALGWDQSLDMQTQYLRCCANDPVLQQQRENKKKLAPCLLTDSLHSHTREAKQRSRWDAEMRATLGTWSHLRWNRVFRTPLLEKQLKQNEAGFIIMKDMTTTTSALLEIPYLCSVCTIVNGYSRWNTSHKLYQKWGLIWKF